MSLSEKGEEIYAKYIEKYGKKPKNTTLLLNFAKSSEINYAMKWKEARQIIKYHSTHQFDQANPTSNPSTTTTSNQTLPSQQRARSSSLARTTSAISDGDKEIYMKYIDKYGKPPRLAPSLAAFAVIPEINKPISNEKAKAIIKYFSTHKSKKSKSIEIKKKTGI